MAFNWYKYEFPGNFAGFADFGGNNSYAMCGAVAQWLAFATRDRKVASSIPDRGIPRNNLG